MRSFTLKSKVQHILFPILFFSLLICFLVTAPNHAESAMRALTVCGRCLIPSLFPFMVISEFFFVSGSSDRIAEICGKPFERVFRLPPVGFICFLAGILFGFPLGAKYVAEYYRRGALSQEEAKILMSFVNASGPAFVIAGVGYGMMGSLRIGFLLYLSQLLAILLFATVVARIFLRGKQQAPPPSNTAETLYAPFRNSAISMITVCGCVLFFSVTLDLFAAVFPTEFLPWIAAFLEIGTATEYISHINSAVALPLCAFSIGFGGLSVQMQIKPYGDTIGVKSFLILVSKLIQGILTVAVFLLLSALFPLDKTLTI